MADLVFTSFSGTTRPTAWGTYDNDAQFRSDADRMVYFVQRELGAPVLESELDLRQIWTCFENATQEWSTTINLHHAKNIMVDLLGRSTGTMSGSENALPLFNTSEFARKILIQYDAEAGLNSPYPWFSASIDLVSDQQRYNLLTPITGILTGSNANQLVQIRRVHHYEPTAAYRFFDTTSVMNFMANNMNFASYSPETIFYLLPIWEDILRGTQLSLNQRVRRSNYSFDIHGYELVVYPTPTKSMKLWYEWTVAKDPMNATIGGASLHKSQGVMSTVSNLAFGHLSYSDINSIGKTWIQKMTLAMCKEVLGNIRSYYSNIPIPDGSITLNGPELLSQAQREMENLRQSLKEILDELSYKKLLADRLEIEELAKASMTNVPLKIYISR